MGKSLRAGARSGEVPGQVEIRHGEPREGGAVTDAVCGTSPAPSLLLMFF